MSDDTPTQRFEPEGSDAPTQRLDAATAGEAVSPEVAEERKSRKLMIILGIIGAALLLAIIILLVVLLVRPSSGTGGDLTPSPTATRSESPTPTSSPTPSATPTPTPTPTQTEAPPPPPPPSNDATVNSFTVNTTTVTCNSQAPGGPFPIYIDFSWSSSNASNVYFGVNTADASTGALFDGLPASGTTADFPPGYTPFEYNCGNASTQYTITVVGSNGSKDSRSVTVVNNGDVG